MSLHKEQKMILPWKRMIQLSVTVLCETVIIGLAKIYKLCNVASLYSKKFFRKPGWSILHFLNVHEREVKVTHLRESLNSCETTAVLLHGKPS